MNRERLGRILTGVAGAALAYLGWKTGNGETLAAGASMVGISIPWPADRERAKQLAELLTHLGKHQQPDDVQKSMEKAERVNSLATKPPKEKSR